MTAMLPWALQQLAKPPSPASPVLTHAPSDPTHTHTRMRIRVWLRPRQIANIFQQLCRIFQQFVWVFPTNFHSKCSLPLQGLPSYSSFAFVSFKEVSILF